MKKHFYWIAIVAMTFTFASCANHSSNIKTDLEIFGLKGKVKKVTEMEYSAEESNGRLVKSRLNMTTEYYFRKDGLLSEIKGHDLRTGSDLRIAYDYSNGKETNVIWFDDAIQEEKTIRRTEWGDLQRITGKYHAYDGSIIMKDETFEYDDKHQLKQRAEYRDQKLEKWYGNYVYDEAGNLLEYAMYGLDKTKEYIYRNTYDEDGLLTSYTFECLKDGRTGTKFYTYTLDEKGNFLVRESRSDYFYPSIIERTIEYY